jgi:hypothetical protein
MGIFQVCEKEVRVCFTMKPFDLESIQKWVLIHLMVSMRE